MLKFETMNPKWKKRIRTTAKITLLVYLALGAILFLIQDLLLFHPRPLHPNHRFSFAQPFEELNLPVGNRNLSIVKFRPDSVRKGIVLFFHGNRENVEHYSQYPALFTQNHYEIWMIDYPGFGKTTGQRSEERMYQDALLMYEKAARQVSNDSIIIYGKSIGTGVASFLAAERPCRQLILETPYYSIDALARHYFPFYPVPLTKYHFPIYEYLKKVKAGITIFHGTTDHIVPYKQGRKLAEENTGVQLITIESGRHNNLATFPLFRRKLDALLRN